MYRADEEKEFPIGQTLTNIKLICDRKTVLEIKEKVQFEVFYQNRDSILTVVNKK